MTLLLFET